MKLIGTYESPFVRRVAAALISLSMDFCHEDLHGYREPARARMFNPVGKVPVLVLDDGETLIDSAAILDHLDEIAGPERALTPHGRAERRRVLQLSAIAATICEQSTLRYFEERRPDGCSDRDLVDRYRSQAIGGFKALEAAAAEGRFLGAATLNQADITAVIAFQYARPIHPDIDLDATAPALSQLVGRLTATPAFASTRPAS
jgi:glutathione S-transferase